LRTGYRADDVLEELVRQMKLSFVENFDTKEKKDLTRINHKIDKIENNKVTSENFNFKYNNTLGISSELPENISKDCSNDIMKRNSSRKKQAFVFYYMYRYLILF
jgi:hypothetical protein